MSFFSETNYEGQNNKSTFKPFYTIKAGENVFRIAPPCRNLPSGQFAVYRKVHFGYGVPDTLNPDKLRMKPFECVQKINYQTKMVEVECAECTKIAQVTKELDDLKEKLKSEGHPEDYIKQATSPQFQWLQAHNLDNKWYCYAKNLAGEWNVLKIGHKVKQSLEDRMKRTLKEDSIKSLDPATGVWFKFNKNGLKGANALTTVEVLKEKVDMGNGIKAEVIKSAPLTADDEKAISALTDVTTCVPVITPAQIKALVDSGGSPEVARTIFALGTKKETGGTNSQALVANSSTSLATPAPVVAQAQPKAPVTTGFVQTTTPKATPNEIKDMSPDAFLRMFANNNQGK